MLLPRGVKKIELNNPPGDNSVRLLLMQKKPDDALNEPSRGFYMHSWCFRLHSSPPSCPGSVLKDTEEQDN